jgi:hypothetical protein
MEKVRTNGMPPKSFSLPSLRTTVPYISPNGSDSSKAIWDARGWGKGTPPESNRSHPLVLTLQLISGYGADLDLVSVIRA